MNDATLAANAATPRRRKEDRMEPARRHRLAATPETVRVGLIDPAYPAVLEIDSGDEVEFETWQLWGDAVTPQTTFAEIDSLRRRHPGAGPHSMTGPVHVRGARPGMTLRIDVLEYRLRDHGFNVLLPRGVGRGLLADELDGAEVRHFALDTATMTTQLCPGVTIPLRPFLGIVGVAPAEPGARSSSAPGPFGGNIDCPELVPGTSLLLPVWQEGALLYAGDAHAAQGCGELCGTALETAMHAARLRITLLEGMRIERPRIETPTHVMTLGFDPDVRLAAQQATHDMVELLALEHGMSRADAYVLCSLQCDLMITQIVNGHNGVHARLSRTVLPKRT
jgi:acetamidase/formamidase